MAATFKISGLQSTRLMLPSEQSSQSFFYQASKYPVTELVLTKPTKYKVGSYQTRIAISQYLPGQRSTQSVRAELA